MTMKIRRVRESVSLLFAAVMFVAAPAAAQNAFKSSEKLGPPLETVKAFTDDFRLVGIGVSAKGRVFATAPSSNVRSHFSMVEVDPKSGEITPYPDAAWNNFSDQGDGKSEWISVQALWVDKVGPSLGARFFAGQGRSGAPAAEAGRVQPRHQQGDPAI